MGKNLKRNLSEANQAEEMHDISDSCKFHHKPRSLPSKCPPIILTKHKHSLTWAKTSFCHMYMVPIPLSSKYCPIYMCSLDFLVCPILYEGNILSSSLPWYITSPFGVPIPVHQNGNQSCAFCQLTFSTDSTLQWWKWPALRFLLDKTCPSHACTYPFYISWC